MSQSQNAEERRKPKHILEHPYRIHADYPMGQSYKTLEQAQARFKQLKELGWTVALTEEVCLDTFEGPMRSSITDFKIPEA